MRNLYLVKAVGGGIDVYNANGTDAQDKSQKYPVETLKNPTIKFKKKHKPPETILPE
jgi:hypothetical protein